MKSRRSIMQAIRKSIDINAFHTFSDKKKHSQRLKLWMAHNAEQTTHLIRLYLIANRLKGIDVQELNSSVVIEFDNNLYN